MDEIRYSALNKNDAIGKIRFMSRYFSDRVDWTSGWLHDYVCSTCSSTLIFDIKDEGFKSNHFVCPHCSSVFSGKKYREAWIYQYRNWYAEQLLQAALCKEEEETKDFLHRYLDFYAVKYAEFHPHGSHAGKGRIMAQSLDEAVFGIHLLKAVYHCRECFQDDMLHKWYVLLFRPMAEFLLPQGNSIHNISVWIQCYIGMVGLVFKDEVLRDSALYGKYGLFQQLEKGTTTDHLWQEGSLHYHYYVLEGLTSLCELLRDSSPDHMLLTCLRDMYLAPLRLSPDGWHLPSFNDGWYPLTLGSYGVQIIKAAYLLQDNDLFEKAYRILREDPELNLLPDVVLARGKYKDDVLLCFNQHVAVIRNPLWVTIKSGSLVAPHAHSDCLSITIEPFSRDLGTPGYSSPINSIWYRSAYSHNCIIIDGKECEKVNNSPCRIIANGVEVSSGVVTRRITIEGDSIIDRTFVHSDGKRVAHLFEWLFHGEGRFNCTESMRPVKTLGTDRIFMLFNNIKEIDADSSFTTTFSSESGDSWEVYVYLPNGMHAYIAETPGNPADDKRHTILLRLEGDSVEFSARYRKISSVQKHKKSEKNIKRFSKLFVELLRNIRRKNEGNRYGTEKR